jgi:RNA polymerase sigma-70 factor (ECF subfamily)
LEGPLPPQWLTSSAPQPDEVVAKQQKRERVRNSLEVLPPDYRAAVVLRYWYDYSYREIASVLDTTESAIKSRLHRARRLLAGQLAAA